MTWRADIKAVGVVGDIGRVTDRVHGGVTVVNVF
jgi:hypothetical protein